MLTCALCQRRCPEPAASDGERRFCASCLVTLGRFASTVESRLRVWKSPSQTGDQPFEAALAEIRAGSAEVAQGDAETHLDLAVTYREMALFDDSVREAGEALRLGTLPLEQASIAAGILFDERCLRVGAPVALELVRETLFRS